MKNRFLLHSLSHGILAVDITNEGLFSERRERGEGDMVPILRFGSWEAAAIYFRSLGADEALLEQTAVRLEAAGATSLTILK